jgi:hypothetical protein
MLGFVVAPSATAAAPPVTPPKSTRETIVTAWRRFKRVATALFFPALLALACTYWLGNQTLRGRFRHHLRPFWVACAAWYVTPWTPWAWLGLAVALYLAPNRGRWLSAREQASLADAACLLAAWQVITPASS